MAYSKPLTRQCQRCTKNAVAEVFNRFNASLGYYCRQHETALLKSQNELERKES